MFNMAVGSEVFKKNKHDLCDSEVLKTIKSKVGGVIQITIYSHTIYNTSRETREREKEQLMPSMLLPLCLTLPFPRLLPPHDVRTSMLLPDPLSPCTSIHFGPGTHSLQAVAGLSRRLEASTSTSTSLSL
jgi:hypothetical protein